MSQTIRHLYICRASDCSYRTTLRELKVEHSKKKKHNAWEVYENDKLVKVKQTTKRKSKPKVKPTKRRVKRGRKKK